MLNVWDRDPGAVCRDCEWERGIWRADTEGHKRQLDYDTCGRAMGHWLKPWQRIVAEFEVV